MDERINDWGEVMENAPAKAVEDQLYTQVGVGLWFEGWGLSAQRGVCFVTGPATLTNNNPR